MAVPADLVPQDAALVDGRFVQVPGVVAAMENAEGFVIQAGAGADVGFAVVAFDVAVTATGDFSQLFVGKGNDLLVHFVDILIHGYYLSFIPLRLSGGVA